MLSIATSLEKTQPITVATTVSKFSPATYLAHKVPPYRAEGGYSQWLARIAERGSPSYPPDSCGGNTFWSSQA